MCRAEHPELFLENDSAHRDRSRSMSSTSGPPKPVTAQGLFIQEKIEQELAKDGTVSTSLQCIIPLLESILVNPDHDLGHTSQDFN